MKIGYFITARLKSSRLKKKILLPLNGNTVLDHVIKRCQSIETIDGVVLCTSTNPQDSELFDYALKHNIKFYAGSEDDVLKRLLDAAKYFGFDAFVSITADNPLHSIYIANQIVDLAKRQAPDFVFTSGLPIGIAPYYINTKALEIAVAMKEESDTEIWGPFVNRPDFFKIAYLEIDSKLFENDLRLTCDYEEDYQLLTNIYNEFSVNYSPDIFELAKLFKDKKIIVSNRALSQTFVSHETIERIKQTFNRHIDTGRETAKRVNHELSPGEIRHVLKL